MNLSLSNRLALGSYQSLMFLLYVVARMVSVIYPSPSLRERLGFYPPGVLDKLLEGQRVWLHAASVGEVNAITPLCLELRKALPGIQIIVTTTSNTGKKMVRENNSADAVFLAPLDMVHCLNRAFQAFNPVIYLIAETEFWPRALLLAAQYKIPTFLLNGRISNRSFPAYLKLRSLFTPALTTFSHCFVQSDSDRKKLVALGVPLQKITLAGQLKHDLSAPDGMAVQKFKETLSLMQRDILFTFGSLRTGEDDILIPLMPELLNSSTDIKILLAPRHLKNVQVIREKLAKMGIASTLRSEIGIEKAPERVVILDSMGELAQSYAFSRAAFVGGTLVPIGGHNLMEPALAAVPVFFGPYTQNVMEAARALLESGGGFQVNSASELLKYFQRCLNEDFSKSAGLKARESVLSLRGATEKTVQGVLHFWPKSAD